MNIPWQILPLIVMVICLIIYYMFEEDYYSNHGYPRIGLHPIEFICIFLLMSGLAFYIVLGITWLIHNIHII
jgi:hypothetical protein